MRSHVLLVSGLLLAQIVCAAEPCIDCDENEALTVSAAYTGEQWRHASGGLATGSRYLDNLDVTMDIDAGRLAGLEGLQLFAYLLYNNGQGFNDELIGSAQGVSNIEATEALRLYELWTQWNFGAGEQSLRVGLYDLNSEFDSIETAGLFINPSHGIGPDLSQTGRNGPSIFPATSLGARLSKSWGAWSAQLAVLDAVPGDVDHPDRTTIRLGSEEGALIASEANYRSDAGRVGVGYWRYSEKFDRLDSESTEDNAGAYVILERPVATNVNMFVRAGVADADINPIHRYLGMGSVYTKVSGEREHQFGIAVAVAEFGDTFRGLEAVGGNIAAARESILELTYRVNLSDWLSIQPDVQYIRHPGANPQLRSGWAAGLRFELGSQWRWPR